jgi:3-oxoacyl-[acyl-carrier-protein] synthase II
VKRRVAITGVGAVTPLGVGAPALIDRWSAGESGIEDGHGRCRDFEPEEHLSRKEVRRADRFTQLALVACREALEGAGWAAEGLPFEPERVGCLIGTGIGGIGTIEDQHDVLRDRGAGAISPLAVPLMMANAASGVIAMQYGLKGQCYGTVSACAAGAHAIGAGLRMVQHGDAEACVVGGSEAGITPLAEAAFAGMGATSPSGMSRPFDRRRDGFVMGEGAAVLVLESEAAARDRGAPVLGWATGYGATADAHHLTAPEPSGDGAARAVELALEDAGIAPDGIDYVNAHGTSTPLNDRSETEALKRALGERARELPVSSLKSAIGHLLGAAGAVEAAATVLALERGVAPPTLGWEERDEACDLDYVPDEARPLQRNGRPLRALSNSFGFGGHNAVLCLEAA